LLLTSKNNAEIQVKTAHGCFYHIGSFQTDQNSAVSLLYMTCVTDETSLNYRLDDVFFYRIDLQAAAVWEQMAGFWAVTIRRAIG